MKLRNINNKLTEQDRSWRTTNAGVHWREFFDSHTKTKYSDLLFRTFSGKTSTEVPNGITREAIAEEIVQRATIILRNPFKFVSGHIEVSLDQFTSLLSGLDVTNQIRRATVLPTVEQVLANAHALRTEEWNNSPHRNPPVLPAKLQLQTVLLPFPHLQTDLHSRYAAFTSCVMALVEECASSATYIADKAFLLEAMRHVEKGDARQCALEFGQGYQSSPNALVQYLRVWLAQVLVLRWNMTKDERDTEVREMISQWKRSPDELVRSIGWSTLPQAM
jgi:hypothetical protein